MSQERWPRRLLWLIIAAVVTVIVTVLLSPFIEDIRNKFAGSSTSAAMSTASIPQGTWSINANGNIGTLNITSLDSQGVVYGDVFGDPLIAFWNANTGHLSFFRSPHADFSSFQIYTGDFSNNTFSGTFISYYINGLVVGPQAQWSASYNASTPNNSLGLVGSPWMRFHNWTILTNRGARGTLYVTNITPNSIISGSVYNNPLLGYWSNNNQISFLRCPHADLSSFQIFHGFLQGAVLTGDVTGYYVSSTSISSDGIGSWQASE